MFSCTRGIRYFTTTTTTTSITQIRLWGRNADHARQCADDIGGDCRVFGSLEDACRGADVIVTVTMAAEPVLYGKWVKEGAIVCGKQLLSCVYHVVFCEELLHRCGRVSA